MYPPIKFCFLHWIYWIDWEKAFSLNFSKGDILYGMSFMSNVYTEVFFDFDKGKKSFKMSMSLNNFTLIHSSTEQWPKNFRSLDARKIIGTVILYRTNRCTLKIQEYLKRNISEQCSVTLHQVN